MATREKKASSVKEPVVHFVAAPGEARLRLRVAQGYDALVATPGELRLQFEEVVEGYNWYCGRESNPSAA